MLVLLAASALAAPFATASSSVLRRGHTTQDYAIRAIVSPSGSLLTLVRTRYALECSDGSTAVRRLILARELGDTVVVDDGRFSTSGTVASGLPEKGSGSLTYRVWGRVRASRITGMLRVEYALDSGVRCTTELVGFALR